MARQFKSWEKELETLNKWSQEAREISETALAQSLLLGRKITF